MSDPHHHLFLSERPLRVACIGGGQLGRMMAMEAPRLHIGMSFLDPAGDACPAAATGAMVLQGSLQDADKIRQLVHDSQADIVTVEIEHINCNVLDQLETTTDACTTVSASASSSSSAASSRVQVQPSGRVLRLIQDKYRQKQHFREAGIPVPPFFVCDSIHDIQTAASNLGLPLMLKARTGAYDGRGNAILHSIDDTAIQVALQKLGVVAQTTTTATVTTNLGLYAEGWIDFDCEIAVMVVRSALHNMSQTEPTDNAHSINKDAYTTRCYPAVNAIQQDSICRIVLAPARDITASVRAMAEAMAMRAIDSLPTGASGVFGVEMFVTRDGTENEKYSVLLNEIAPRPHNTGHYTQDACVCSQFENHLRAVCGLPLGSTALKVEAAAMVNVLGTGTLEDTIRSSNAAMSMPTATVHWYGKVECRKGRKMGHINLTANSHGELDRDLLKLLELEGIPHDLLPLKGIVKVTPLVGVIMGSQSDLPTMNAAVDVLKKFDIPYEVDIVSAHRTPDKLMKYSRHAVDRGLRVLIAGAGGAAHLPGMVAAMTPLPVIGVPVKTSTLSGVDSLYSIVQMPRGVPVATVAIGNAMNAGLLAVRILSTSRPALRQQMIQYQTDMKDLVDDSSAQLLELGSDAFLEMMDNKSQSVNV